MKPKINLATRLLTLTAAALMPLATAFAEGPTTKDNYKIKITKGSGSFQGTVLFAVNQAKDPQYKPVIVEVDSTGKVVWEYQNTVPGMITDINKLDNGNILYVDMFKGIREIDRSGKLVWKWDGAATHHAQLLENGNILAVSTPGNWVKEIDFDGRTVWEWNAKDHIKDYGKGTYDNIELISGSEAIHNSYAVFREAPFLGQGEPDWTHVNSAQRLANGDTVLSLRNLDLVTIVNKQGETVWSFGPLAIKHQHSPQILENGNMLITDNGNSRALEINMASQKIVWQYKGLTIPAMGHAQRMYNGDTLITDSFAKRLIMVNSKGEITWELFADEAIVPGIYRAKHVLN